MINSRVLRRAISEAPAVWKILAADLGLFCHAPNIGIKR
jgi:hypothetical protein